MKMIYIVLLQFLLSVACFGQNKEANVDCLLLADENSIICKYTRTRINNDRDIIFHWIDPNGLLSRKRELIFPANHGSIYDYRYISGRLSGTWTFKVVDGKNEYKTNFIIK